MIELDEEKMKRLMPKVFVRVTVAFAAAVILFSVSGVAYLMITGQSIDFGSGDDGLKITLEKEPNDAMGPDGSEMVLQFRAGVSDEQIGDSLEKYAISTWAYETMISDGYSWFRPDQEMTPEEFNSLVASLRKEELIERVIPREEFLSEYEYPYNEVIKLDSPTSWERINETIFIPLALLLLAAAWVFCARYYTTAGFRQLLTLKSLPFWIVSIPFGTLLGFHLVHLFTCPLCWIWTIPLTAIIWLIIAFGLRLIWSGEKRENNTDVESGGEVPVMDVLTRDIDVTDD